MASVEIGVDVSAFFTASSAAVPLYPVRICSIIAASMPPLFCATADTAIRAQREVKIFFIVSIYLISNGLKSLVQRA